MNEKDVLLLGFPNSGRASLVNYLTHCDANEYIRNKDRRRRFQQSFTFYDNNSTIYRFLGLPGHRFFIPEILLASVESAIVLLLIDAVTYSDLSLSAEWLRFLRGQILLLNTFGSKQLILCLNKMDRVNFEEDVYIRIKYCIEKQLQELGYKETVICIPMSIIPTGCNINEPSERMPWYKGPTVSNALKSIETPMLPQKLNLRLSVSGVYNMAIIGHLEYGVLKRGMKLRVLPQGSECTVTLIEERNIKKEIVPATAHVGFQIQPNLDCKRGNIFCSAIDERIKVIQGFTMLLSRNNEPEKIVVGDVLSIACHSSTMKCKIVDILLRLNPRSGAVMERFPIDWIPANSISLVRLVPQNPIVLERYKEFPALGRVGVRFSDRNCAFGYGLVHRIRYYEDPRSIFKKLFPFHQLAQLTDVSITCILNR